ncbi:hypothetical protein MRX96_003679 [Rhipicephalus microplus]
MELRMQIGGAMRVGPREAREKKITNSARVVYKEEESDARERIGRACAIRFAASIDGCSFGMHVTFGATTRGGTTRRYRDSHTRCLLDADRGGMRVATARLLRLRSSRVFRRRKSVPVLAKGHL